MATLTYSYHLLIKNLHRTCYSFRDICNDPEEERELLKGTT